MSIDGGVVLVGIAEKDGVATAITPSELRGAMERVQQVIDANVSPALPVEVTPLREQEGDEKGVLVISVPASWSAPHEYALAEVSGGCASADRGDRGALRASVGITPAG